MNKFSLNELIAAFMPKLNRGAPPKEKPSRKQNPAGSKLLRKWSRDSKFKHMWS